MKELKQHAQKPTPEPRETISPALARLLAETDRGLRCLEPENPFQFYEFLHKTACRIAPVHAFYVCLYSHADQTLFFPYNVDGDIYDPPITMAMSDGPTSQVIRCGQPVVWNCEAEARQVHCVMFGQTDRLSLSAMTVPIRADTNKTGLPPLGVLSCQAYQPQAYPPEAVRALQWLADRAGMALTHARDDAAWHYQLGLANESASAKPRPLIALTDEFVQILQRLGDRAEALRRLLPEGSAGAPFADAVDQLCQACYQAQTQANQLPLRPAFSLPVPPDSPLALLTPMERTVLEQLAHGKSNRTIADELCVAEDTVKFHCKNIFQKLEVGSRSAAARVWLTFTLPQS